MIERYNREMQQYVTVAPKPDPAFQEPPSDEALSSAAHPQDNIQTAAVSAPQEQGTGDGPESVSADTAAQEAAAFERADDGEASAPQAAETERVDAAAVPSAAAPPYSREIPYPSTEDVVPLTQIREEGAPPEKPAEPYPRNAVGFLLVQVFSARGVLPVEGATVTVSGTENGKPVLYHTVFTDRSGLSPLMSLPAVSAQLSMKPGAYQPYTTYTVRVQKDGFYPVENTRVPIYEGIVARQPVNLVPLPENQREGEPQIFPENGPADL